MKPSTLGVALGAALALFLAPSAGAQCFGPDGLSSPLCCTDVPADLPAFPPIDMQGRGFCSSSCAITGSECIRIIVTPPAAFGCGEYGAQFSVLDCAGASILSGFPLHLDYTRTWQEDSAAGVPHQVWRFAAKIDVSLVAGAPPSCLAAPCLSGYPTAFFYGYVDYALNCASGTFDSSLVLFHNCDRYIHDQAHSNKPGTWHPDTTYAIVGPDTAANPFVPAVSTRPGGPIAQEAVRRSAAGSLSCVTEERITSGLLLPLISACACPLSFASTKNTASFYRAVGSCIGIDGLPSSFDSLDTTPFGFPWLHLLTTSVGSWTTGTTYPGPETAFVEEGAFAYHDSCAVTGTSSGNFLEIHYGGSTTDGWTITSPLSDNLIDMASNYSQPLPATLTPPFTGSAFPTRHLTYTNVP